MAPECRGVSWATQRLAETDKIATKQDEAEGASLSNRRGASVVVDHAGYGTIDLEGAKIGMPPSMSHPVDTNNETNTTAM